MTKNDFLHCIVVLDDRLVILLLCRPIIVASMTINVAFPVRFSFANTDPLTNLCRYLSAQDSYIPKRALVDCEIVSELAGPLSRPKLYPTNPVNSTPVPKGLVPTKAESPILPLWMVETEEPLHT